MSYEVYKILHITSIAAILMSLGGLTLISVQGDSITASTKRFAMISHGVGVFLALVAGFGLLARLEIAAPWPTWVWGKVAIWLMLGVGGPLVLKKPNLARLYWLSWIILVALAATLANFKP